MRREAAQRERVREREGEGCVAVTSIVTFEISHGTGGGLNPKNDVLEIYSW